MATIPGVGHRWGPGETGNRNGRPRKGRTWTDLIDKEGRKRITLPDGSEVSGKRFAAQRLIELLTRGKTTLADGATTIEVNGDGWFSVYKWSVVQNDGPAETPIDVTTGGKAIERSTVQDDAEHIATTLAILVEAGVIPAPVGKDVDAAMDAIHSADANATAAGLPAPKSS